MIWLHRNKHIYLLSPSPFWWIIKILGELCRAQCSEGGDSKGESEWHFWSKSGGDNARDSLGCLVLLQEKHRVHRSSTYQQGRDRKHVVYKPQEEPHLVLLMFLLVLWGCGPGEVGATELPLAPTLLCPVVPGSCESVVRRGERTAALTPQQCEVESGMYEDKEPNLRSRLGCSGPTLARHQGCMLFIKTWTSWPRLWS